MIRQVKQTASRMITPPMVGVPALTRCDWGPSARICCPMPSFLRKRIHKGMMSPAIIADMKMARKTW